MRHIRLGGTLAACAIGLAIAYFGSLGHTAPPTTKPPNGLRVETPQVYALINARLQLAPGKVIERGSVVIREGRIAQVGADIAIPAEAHITDLAGKTIYAGFIDAYSPHEIDRKQSTSGAPYWNDNVRPQLKVKDHLSLDKERNAALRSQGITAQLVAPEGAIIDGAAALVTTGDESLTRSLISDGLQLHLHLTTKRGQSRDAYPTSPMGAVALARQAMLDAQWYRQAWQVHRADTTVGRPEQNDALAALTAERTYLIDAPNEWYLLRADRFAKEFGLSAAMIGSGREYRRLDAIAATGRTVIVPLNFPQPPNVATPEAALNASLVSLMHWDHAPANPAQLANAGVKIALTTHGLKSNKDFLKQLRQAVERGLTPDAALAALTTTPAILYHVEDRLGQIAPGMMANLVIASGDLFAKETKIERVWIEGHAYDVDPPADYDLRGSWNVATTAPMRKALKAKLELAGSDKLQGKFSIPHGDEKDPLVVELAHVGQRNERFTATFDAEKLGIQGIARLSALATIAEQDPATIVGEIVWADGAKAKFQATRTATSTATKDEKKDDDKSKPKLEIDRAASFPLNYPLGAFGNTSPPEQAKAVLFTHATLWTCAEQGVLEDTSLLVENGQITAIGNDIELPQGATVIDLKGQHRSPGIVDCHSHMATDGGINETGQAITAEVRIGDFIDPDDVNIYRQLAGGVTTINVLHGSANPIGGQNQVCKLRWGELDEAMKFAQAPAGIKFALGENVKQSNWGERFTTRYPQTRMGVEQIMRDEFAAALRYDAAWERWNKEHIGLPPRRDLELEAVAQILRGERWIHCHSYRQDEILTLLKLTDEYKIRIGTLQHILEGYKVADAMAARGIMGSSFSDWWAYKFEVFDAIPHNGAIMHNAGVVVSFNSDDLELARHLNHEAAKAMKYGGVPVEEAIKFVTINPAKQLRIDHLVGSLEIGKSADLAIWSGPPMSTTSRCEQTWIEGKQYFQRQNDRDRRDEAKNRHLALVQKILASGDAMLSPEELDGMEPDLWPRYDEYCGHDHGDHDHDHEH